MFVKIPRDAPNNATNSTSKLRTIFLHWVKAQGGRKRENHGPSLWELGENEPLVPWCDRIGESWKRESL